MSREARRLSAENQFAHCGMDAVSADCQVPIGCCAVVKIYFDPIRMLLQVHASMIQMNYVGGQSRGQKIEELSAMKVVIGRPKSALAFVAQRLTGKDAPVIPVANLHGQRPYSIFAHRTRQAHPLQYPAGIGTDLDAGANFTQCRCLLEDLNLDSSPAQRQRGDEPANSCPDDDHSHVCCRLKLVGQASVPVEDARASLLAPPFITGQVTRGG